jgi:acyl-CoA synthetase (AMP-forming)/AMP-acid ligase II
MQGENRTGSIGLPFPDVDCRIISLDDEMTVLGPGEIGELVIKGPQVMKGYHNMPTETANTLRDGWLYTGDIARMDEDGYFYIVDRKKDMFISGGENIYPAEIESVLYQHPAVHMCAVVGLPDPRWGEAGVACIVLKPGHQAGEAELLAFLSERLARYKVPKRTVFLESLPISAAGKILKRELKEALLAAAEEKSS